MSAMMPDPFDRPLEVRPEPQSLMQVIVTSFFPQGLDGRKLLFATPAKWPRNVSDAEVGGPCDVCGGEVWVSPSSQRAIADEANKGRLMATICLECFRTRLDAIANRS